MQRGIELVIDYILRCQAGKLKPNYVVHGDDWKTGVQKQVRQQVIDKLNQWGGKVIDVPYTKDVSSTKLHNHLKDENSKTTSNFGFKSIKIKT